eukprot:TRINITY_DN5583_c0_g1_i4.p1 TRINITY_DN5583_c0_g1~~TRINITY_DN5583_c0_g1_i4.p1  ORF type:complete len:109 (-),score=14.39 TRINITY_DN5583_c0_g1_i4:130-456(-)
MVWPVIGRIIGMASTVALPILIQAWKQVSSEAGPMVNNIKQGARNRVMTIDEAQKILGVQPPVTLKKISDRYAHLYKANSGTESSSYLLGKVEKAKDLLEKSIQSGKP